MRRAIVWFRNDLRLHDNEALTDALTLADEVIPIFIFDERVFKGKTGFGFPKTGKYRAKFIYECVINLKKKLRNLNSDLYVGVGLPEEIIFQKAREWKTNWVFCNRERTKEEVEVQDALEQNLWSIGQEVKYCRGKMLFHTADLPFPITHCPDNFSAYRKETEHFVKIRKPFNTPVEPFKDITTYVDWGEVPRLESLGFAPFSVDKGLELKGGEDVAIELLNHYLWSSDLISKYKETRNELLGKDYSSKFSAYLSAGCISPKFIFHEIKRYEQERLKNDSTYWLIFELMWRDFFRFMAKKHGNKIFQIGGIKNKPDVEVDVDLDLFNKWKEGATGIPFIDANMKELNSSGYMSNRGRQITASFLVKDLKLNWIMGAEYFESLLIDYDPCSNYGNWNYISGVGSDLREDRYFNVLAQARKYDPKGEYVKYWLPELEKLPSELVHIPDQVGEIELDLYNVSLGVNYPSTCFSSKKWG